MPAAFPSNPASESEWINGLGKGDERQNNRRKFYESYEEEAELFCDYHDGVTTSAGHFGDGARARPMAKQK